MLDKIDEGRIDTGQISAHSNRNCRGDPNVKRRSLSALPLENGQASRDQDRGKPASYSERTNERDAEHGSHSILAAVVIAGEKRTMPYRFPLRSERADEKTKESEDSGSWPYGFQELFSEQSRV